MLMDKNSDNIQVMVRVRPLNGRERNEDSKTCVIIDQDRAGSILLDSKPDPKMFNFDWVGGDRTQQQEIFEVCGKPMVQTCLEGYNCCIFAYGQTGAGKTYTMQGRGLEMDNEDITNRGLQPRVFDYIFSIKSKDMQENPNVKYLISCTYLEIYNEQIMDLLEPVASNMQIREDLKKGVYVEGLKEEIVDNSEDTIELLRKGAMNRHVGSTNMNMESSRSHSLFTMNIERKLTTGGTINVRTSKFHFVDLAGSERQKMTAAAGERLKEAGNINKSLSVLGQVINSLVEIAEGKQRHIRYRDSKLTFILKDSLGGNSKTCLIANVSPASSSFAETLSTLKFAARAKQIKNKASINEDSSGSLEGLKAEIRQLKEEIVQYKRTISSIETEQKRVGKSPKVTPYGGNFGMGIENQKSLLEQNQRSLETERLLKDTMEVLTENEFLLQAELAKKEEYINTFKSAVEMYNHNEIQYRTVISLNQEKIQRLLGGLSERMVDEEQEQLKKETAALLEIVSNTPAVMKTYMDNVEMREKIDNLEAEINPNSSISVAQQLQENLVFLQELTLKIDENIRERKALSERLERMGPSKGGLGSPDKQRRLEDDIRSLRMEHNQQIDKLNFELLELKQREMEARRIAEIESKKFSDVYRDYENLRELKQRNEEKYEKKINEVYQEFERIQNTRFNVDGLEKTIDQLNLKNLELKEQMFSYKEKYEDMMQLYQEMEECIKTTLNEKEEVEKVFRSELNKTNVEKGVLENTVASLENRMNIILGDLDKSKNELNDLTQTLAELYSKENEYKLSLDSLYQENVQLQDKYTKLDDQKSTDIIQLQSFLEKEKMKAENIDAERAKIQEELDTLNQTFNYNVNELEEKKKLVSELQMKLNEQEKRYSDLSQESARQQEYNSLLEKQLFEHQKENSPANLALKENAELKENIIHLKNGIRNLEEEVQRKLNELEEANNKIFELNGSVQHYTSAYKDAHSKLETKSNELRDVQTTLESKLSEMAQLEQELKISNDNTLRRESEILDLKSQNNKLSMTINMLETNIQEGEKQLRNLESELQFKQSENTLLSERVSETSKKLAELETEMQTTKISHLNELEELTDNLILFKTTCDTKSNEVHTLTMDLKEAEERAKLFEERLNNLNQATQHLQEEKLSLETQMSNFKEETFAKISELENAFTTSEEMVKDLQNRLEAAFQRSSDLEKELFNKGEALKEKEAIIEQAARKIHDLESGLAVKEGELKEIQSQVQDYEKLVKELENQNSDKATEIGKHLKAINELEILSAEKDKILGEISSKLEEASQEIARLENTVSMKEENLREQNLSLERSFGKVSELEGLIAEKQNEIARFTQEGEIRDRKIEGLEGDLVGRKKEIDQLNAKVNDYVKEVSQMEQKLKEEQKNMNDTVTSFRQEMEKQQTRSAEEKKALVDSFAPREKAYQQQVEELTKDLNVALQDLSAEKLKPKELQAKIETLEKEIEEKDTQIKEYIDGMLQMKQQLDGYIELINQLNELPKLRQENTKLKSELKKQEDLIMKLNLQAAEHFKQQEEEINRIKESYSKLENQHQFIMATASIKDNEAAKSREEIRLMLNEKEKSLIEIRRLKENEIQLKRLKEESDEEVKRVTNEKLALLVQLDNLEKTNTQLAGHNNFKQKVDHLAKVKEENTKLREEKTRLQEKLNQALGKSEQVQKKLDDLAKKRNLDPSMLESELSEAQYLQIEVDKIKIENKLLFDAASKINQLLNVNFYHRKNIPLGAAPKDLNKTLDGVQELINVLTEKEKEIREKEREIEAKRLHYNIIERELVVIKQKYQLSLANPELDTTNNFTTGNKENVNDLVMPESQLPQKLDKFTPSVGLTNGKRTSDDLHLAHKGGRPTPHRKPEMNKLKDGKSPFRGFESKHDFARILNSAPSVGDITNNQDPVKRVKHN